MIIQFVSLYTICNAKETYSIDQNLSEHLLNLLGTEKQHILKGFSGKKFLICQHFVLSILVENNY